MEVPARGSLLLCVLLPASRRQESCSTFLQRQPEASFFQGLLVLLFPLYWVCGVRLSGLVELCCASPWKYCTGPLPLHRGNLRASTLALAIQKTATSESRNPNLTRRRGRSRACDSATTQYNSLRSLSLSLSLSLSFCFCLSPSLSLFLSLSLSLSVFRSPSPSPSPSLSLSPFRTFSLPSWDGCMEPHEARCRCRKDDLIDTAA